jgi:hypothetical protein
VQVDTIVLGTATTAVIADAAAQNFGAAASVTNYTGWHAVTPKTCASYRVRANYSVRWATAG